MTADDRLLAYEADELLADGSWAAGSPPLEYDLDSMPAEAVRERFTARCETFLDRM
jgi:hypothetical protein